LLCGLFALLVASVGITWPTRPANHPLVGRTISAVGANPWQYFFDHAIYMVGDSLTCGMRPVIPVVFPGRDVLVDCFPGIVTAQADVMIRNREALPPLAPTAVVAVGGNDTEPLNQFLWMVEGTIDLFPPTERIFWVNYASLIPGNNDPTKNALVAFDANTFHHNVTVIDWASVIGQHHQDFLPDLVHCTAPGYLLRAETILSAVGP
jgi:hypothetical protein